MIAYQAQMLPQVDYQNDDCPCGSGKKYKKCCLSRNVIIPNKLTNKTHKSEKILIKTLTNELFQPMRLYYIIHNKDRLEDCFKGLKCLKYHNELNDWVVEYADEAAKIGLSVAPNKVPKKVQPLIIATIYIENDTTMFIDVRSIERASKLIEFINKYVSKNIAEITHAAIYNQLVTTFDTKESINDIDYDDIFNQENVTVIDPEKTIREMNEFAEKYQNQEDRIQALMERTQENAKKPLPKVEKFPVYFYEEGIESFSTSCQMRQMIAMEHYYGETDYSFYDLTQEFFKNTLDRKIEGGWVRKEKTISN